MSKRPVRIGVGGPVGFGKTALVDALCKRMRERYRLGVITNDIFTLRTWNVSSAAGHCPAIAS